MMPELEYKSEPQDRSFFFNILNTLYVDIVDRMVFNAEKARNNAKRKLEDEIEVDPQF